MLEGAITRRAVLAAGVLGGWLSGGEALADPGERDVLVLQTPGGGIQPQAVTDGRGVVHVLYFRGEARGGDLFYTRWNAASEQWSSPMQVNRRAGSAVAAGTIRGGQLALGRGGRVHVVWNGSAKAAPPTPAHAFPVLYTRLDDRGTAFEPERNLMRVSSVLDGGASVAADREGRVYVGWHAQAAGRGSAEAPHGGGAGHGGGDHSQARQVFLARSLDDGRTFAPERPVDTPSLGACPCCGVRMLADRAGGVHLLYRASEGGVNRDMVLLSAPAPGERFVSRRLDAWAIRTCPMSSASLWDAERALLAAWETQGQVHFAALDGRTGKPSAVVTPEGAGGTRKHPVVVRRKDGQTLLVWTEGTGWQRGGALAWERFDRDGRVLGRRRLANAVPVWGLPTAATLPDGRFLVIH